MRSAWVTVFKVALAALLTWYVLSHIETRDRVVGAADVGGEETSAVGKIEGDWRGADWSFQSDADGARFTASTLPDGWKLEPGFFTLLRELRWEYFALAAGFWAVLLVIVTWRWQILLRAAQVGTGFARAFRLCFIGYFFNNFLPGLTGGDLVRAVLVTRGLETGRARAAMSVLVDRVLGLFGLLMLGGAVLIFGDFDRGELSSGGVQKARLAVLAFLGLAALGGSVYLSARARRALRIDAILARLPKAAAVAKLDEAVTLYRHKLGAVATALGLTLVLQTCAILSFWSIGLSLGTGLSVADVFAIYPLVQTVSSVPVAPAGWGVGETLYGQLFAVFGSTFTLGVAASVLFRLTTQVGVGLIGGLVWVLSGEKKQGIPIREVPA